MSKPLLRYHPEKKKRGLPEHSLLHRFSTFCLLTFIAAVQLHAETFRNPYRIPTSSDPSSVIVVDLNGDGLPDIVYGDNATSPGKLHVLLAQPGAPYVAAPTITLPANVGTGCRALDTNRDGRQDLVCAYSQTFNASLVTFLGNGDGTFGAPTYTAMPTAGSNYFDPGIYSPADFNSDGIPDLMVLDALNQRTYVMLGEGNGSFKLASTLNASLPAVAVDVNGDGKPDLLFVEGPYVMLGNGDGTFGPNKSYSQGFDYDNVCAYADMDGDGHVDAVCGYAETINVDINGATHLIILHGNPDGSFNPTPVSDKVFGNHDTPYDGMGTFDFPLAVLDLNGDGIPDILAYATDGYTVLLGRPGLTFSYPKHYAAGSLAPYGSYTQQIVDINGDGQPDIVASGTNGIYISYGRNDGSFATAPAFEVGQVLGHATFADFNGDGIPDVAATGDTTIEVSLGNGDGTFAPYTPLPNGNINFSTPLSAANASILHGDFNGDGKQDLLAIGSSSVYQYDSYIYFGHGDGTFAPLIKIANSSTIFPQFYDGEVADLNGDGRDDILSSDTNSTVSSASPNIYVGLSNGDGTFQPVITKLPVELTQNGVFNAAISPPALADFDHDGKLDAVVGEISNAYVLKGHGDGSFDSTPIKLPIPASGNAGEGAEAVVTGDFDGDGNRDFAVLYLLNGLNGFPTSTDAEVFVYYGNGDGTFSAPVTAGVFDHQYSMFSASDLNGDGRDDLILRTSNALYDNPSLSILHAAPGRRFASEVNYTAGTGLSDLAALDVNRDGLPDLLVANNGASSVTVLLNLGNVPVVSGTLTASPEPSTIGKPFSLSAVLTPPSPGTLTGNVEFSIDGADVGSAPLVANAATFPVSTPLAIGTHSLTATWLGDSTYAPVTLSATHTIIGYPVAISLTAQPNPAAVGQLVTIKGSITSANDSNPTPFGTYTLTDNGVTIANGNVLTFTFTRGFGPGGNHALTLTYSGDAFHNMASTSTVLAITPVASATILLSSPNPSTYGQPVTLTASISDNLSIEYHELLTSGTVTFSGFPGGPVTVPVPATIVGDTNTVTYTISTLPAGSYPITATFSGNPSFNSSTSTMTQVVNPAPTTITLSANPTTAYRTQTVTLTTHVIGALNPPTGTVQFLDGGLLIATVSLTSGNATFATTLLTSGTHILTGIYSGDSNNLTSTSASATEIILPSDFSLSITPASLTLVTGHHTTLTLTATSVGEFSDTVQLNIGPLPLFTTASFTPAALKLTPNGSATSRIYLDTDAVIGYLSQIQPRRNPTTPLSSTLAAVFVLILLPLTHRRGRRLPALIAVAITATLLIGASGCSGKYPGSTSPGTYKLQITATGTQTPITHSITLPLIVTN
jgi:hypothetical protein